MSQSRRHSFLEAWANIGVGFAVNLLANWLIFPRFGWRITLSQNLTIGVLYTCISLARSYGLRRLFNRWHS